GVRGTALQLHLGIRLVYRARVQAQAVRVGRGPRRHQGQREVGVVGEELLLRGVLTEPHGDVGAGHRTRGAGVETEIRVGAAYVDLPAGNCRGGCQERVGGLQRTGAGCVLVEVAVGLRDTDRHQDRRVWAGGWRVAERTAVQVAVDDGDLVLAPVRLLGATTQRATRQI